MTSLKHIYVWVVALGLALAGCPSSSESAGPVDTCESIGQQCRLGGGQLGVCSMRTDGVFECEPQH